MLTEEILHKIEQRISQIEFEIKTTRNVSTKYIEFNKLESNLEREKSLLKDVLDFIKKLYEVRT